jgi:hypothetical protein
MTLTPGVRKTVPMLQPKMFFAGKTFFSNFNLIYNSNKSLNAFFRRQ